MALAHSAKGAAVLRDRRKFERKHESAFRFHGNKRSAYSDVPKKQRAESMRKSAIRNQQKIKASFRAFGPLERGVMKKKVMPWADKDELARKRLRNFVGRFKRTTLTGVPVLPDWTRARCEEVFRSAKNIGVDRKYFRLMCQAIDERAPPTVASEMSGRERARLQHIEKLRQRHEREARRKATLGIAGAKALELLKNRQIDRDLLGRKGAEALAAVKNRQPEDLFCSHDCESFRSGSVNFDLVENKKGSRVFVCRDCGCRAIILRNKKLHPKPASRQDDVWSGLTDLSNASFVQEESCSATAAGPCARATQTETSPKALLTEEDCRAAQEKCRASCSSTETGVVVRRPISVRIVKRDPPENSSPRFNSPPPAEAAPVPEPVAPVPAADAAPVPDKVLSGIYMTQSQAEDFALGSGHTLRRHVKNVIPYSHERRLVNNRNVRETKESLEMAYVELDDAPLLPPVPWWEDRGKILKVGLLSLAMLVGVVSLAITIYLFPEAYVTGLTYVAYALLWFFELDPLIKCAITGTCTLILSLIALAWWLLSGSEEEEWPRVIPYCPHMVSCAISEYRRGTNVDVAVATMRQKMLRLATLPIPDFDAAQVLDGSEQVALFLVKDQDFAGRAPLCHGLAVLQDVL